ncbi:hypothetical protein VP1G_11016 [Cytospora mali]|uniref:Uncharacterized protein n=1 Tax=Cytospora mali TaxID=578113 RepID=A0A194V3E7_CYTMA|nr:hypothetical protein VP1G_11016 [Valsa mali var. pyri (nom. inval.)]
MAFSAPWFPAEAETNIPVLERLHEDVRTTGHCRTPRPFGLNVCSTTIIIINLAASFTLANHCAKNTSTQDIDLSSAGDGS